MTMAAPTPKEISPEEAQDFRDITRRIEQEVGKLIVGQRDVVRNVMISIIAGGHVLLEGVPGLGKTALVRTIGEVLELHFSRIQFTPDLMPADIVGTNILLDDPQGGRQFRFQPGPVFTNLLLADEINRATPKTQSALLEAMQEKTVTVSNRSYRVERPFFVLATQNPIDMEGTYPLPEAQLDRFLIRISMGYPGPKAEIEMLGRQQHQHPLEMLQQVVTPEELLAAQQAVKEVYVDDSIKEYIVQLVGLTRKHEDVYLGASPRGSLALYRASQARAMLEGRNYVIPDDVKSLAEITLAHRLIMSPSARMKGLNSDTVVQELLQKTVVPGIKAGKA